MLMFLVAFGWNAWRLARSQNEGAGTEMKRKLGFVYDSNDNEHWQETGRDFLGVWQGVGAGKWIYHFPSSVYSLGRIYNLFSAHCGPTLL